MTLLYTPREKRTFVVFCYTLILAQPVFSFCFYVCNLINKVYPPDQDSIMIGIANDFVLWLVWMPIVLYFFHKTVFRDYPSRVPLWAWNGKKLIWSGVWTTLFLSLLITPVRNISFDFAYRNPFELLDTLLWAWLYANLRAIIVTRPETILAAEAGW